MVSSIGVLPRSYIVDCTLCDSIDLDDLRSRALSANNSNRLTADIEDVRQKFDELFVRRAVDRRGRERIEASPCTPRSDCSTRVAERGLRSGLGRLR
jgi:hypothetical protein